MQYNTRCTGGISGVMSDKWEGCELEVIIECMQNKWVFEFLSLCCLQSRSLVTGGYMICTLLFLLAPMCSRIRECGDGHPHKWFVRLCVRTSASVHPRMQGLPPVKPGKVREFVIGQGKVREFRKSRENCGLPVMWLLQSKHNLSTVK